MKIAVVGASGFIGSRAVESFTLGDGPSVVAISRHPSRLTLAARFAVDLRIADALDIESMTRAFTGCSSVLYAVRAESAHLKRLPVVLVRAAAEAGVRRIVYLSDASVHGANPPTGTDERAALHVRHANETVNALVTAERQFFTECRRADMAGFALRPPVVYGPRSALVATIAAELRDGRAWLFNQGEGICNAVYVDNLLAAIRLCLKAKTGAGQAYLVGDAETITWRDFYHAIARELDYPFNRIRYLNPAGRPETGSRPEPPAALPPDLSISVERAAAQQSTWKSPFQLAAKQLGYAPPVPFADAIHRTCAWWRFAHGDYFAAA